MSATIVASMVANLKPPQAVIDKWYDKVKAMQALEIAGLTEKHKRTLKAAKHQTIADVHRAVFDLAVPKTSTDNFDAPDHDYDFMFEQSDVPWIVDMRNDGASERDFRKLFIMGCAEKFWVEQVLRGGVVGREEQELASDVLWFTLGLRAPPAALQH